MLLRIAVHLGEAESKFTLAKLFKPLDLENTNEYNFLKMSMVCASCVLENVSKLCLKRIRTKPSISPLRL